MPFPLKIRVQIAPGADLTADPAMWVWEDITDYVRPRISITNRGRSSESGTAQPSRSELTLKDPTGEWLPYNRASTRWPGWRKGCPLRVQVLGSAGWVTRHTGYVDDRKPRLASSDAVDTYEVDVTASGILRRLNQGVSIRSPLYRFLTGQGPDGYLPLEDGPGADRPAPHAPTQGPATGADVEFGASAAALPGASAVARLTTSAGWIRMTVPLVDRPSIGSPVSTALFYVTSPSLSAEADLATVVFDGAALSRLVVRASSSGLRVTAYNPAGTQVDTVFRSWPADATPTTGWVGVSLAVWQPAASAVVTVRIHGAGSRTLTAASSAGFSGAGGLGRITDVTLWAAGVDGTTVAHLWARNAFAQPPDSSWAAAGYSGEDAGARFERLCGEASVPCVPVGTAGTLMGPQAAGDLMALLREVETTDGGLLYEALDGRLAYLPRVARYNRPVAWALQYEQLSSPFSPVDDDQATRNDMTVTRSGGSSARYADEEHAARHGRYEGSATVSLDGDARLLDHAAWRVHLGTVDTLRHPLASLNLRNPKVEPQADAWLGCDVGSRLTIAGAPPQVAAGLIDQQIEGYAETIDKFSWTVALNMAPNAPWQVAEVGGDARVAASGSTLAAELPEAGMSLMLASTSESGPWTQNADHMPLDIRVGGEQVTASAIGPAAQDTFGRTVSSGLGALDTGQVWALLGTAGAFNVDGARATITHTAVSSGRIATIDTGVTDHRVRASWSVPQLATGTALTAYVVARFVDDTTYYSARIGWIVGNQMTCSIRRRAAGVESTVASVVVPYTAQVDVMYSIMLDVAGSTVRARLWPAGGAEPAGWDVTYVDPTPLTGTRVGLRTTLDAGNTNTLPFVYATDDFAVITPQRVTLSARGVNGVEASWPAGTDVDVWQPAIVAL
ncbi:hypothetical protein [Micromonospora sp. NPDC023633]|uniref:hypothetical protein n=1 Tax=Micromonospora sp. NPDC023633 TaxID=3154320 RepID=UPI003409A18D